MYSPLSSFGLLSFCLFELCSQEHGSFFVWLLVPHLRELFHSFLLRPVLRELSPRTARNPRFRPSIQSSGLNTRTPLPGHSPEKLPSRRPGQQQLSPQGGGEFPKASVRGWGPGASALGRGRDALQQQRPPPVADAGRSGWGRGQQDASVSARMLGAATRGSRRKLPERRPPPQVHKVPPGRPYFGYLLPEREEPYGRINVLLSM